MSDRGRLRRGRHNRVAAFSALLASTVRLRANKAWKADGLTPITPHQAPHRAISYFIAAGLDREADLDVAGHGDVRETWNRRYCEQARQ